MGINLASYVGATEIREAVIGYDNRAPTPAELEKMKALVREAMHDGAVGVSSSLQYAPAPYATAEELIALAAEGAKLGGIYATHMRSEGDAIVPAQMCIRDRPEVGIASFPAISNLAQDPEYMRSPLPLGDENDRMKRPVDRLIRTV